MKPWDAVKSLPYSAAREAFDIELLASTGHSLARVRLQARGNYLPLLNHLKRLLTPGKRWRHLKRGSEYEVAFPDAEVQVSTRPLVEGDRVTVYVGEDGKAWVRLQAEFEDGRYEPVGDA